tara:strand:+ start:285 stop:608 length:324 start_codon:yes stop_codon:yes gene_type:complete
MIISNCILSIGVGIITYILLYLNKLQNLNNEVTNNNENIKCISSYEISLKIPLIISIIIWCILNNINNTDTNNIINTIELRNSLSGGHNNNISDNIELFTDNMSYWF